METNENPMARLHRINEQRRTTEEPAREKNYQETSKRRLRGILEKKLHTSFIGAVAQFEIHFGHLWGHGKDVADCTERQLEWREVWNICRNNILNNGNNQIRAAVAELALYSVIYNRYQLDLTVHKQEAQPNG